MQLPTEAQWEYAAGGPCSLKYPWGDRWDGTKANHADVSLKNTGAMRRDCTGDNDGIAYTAPVGSYPANASWCGALDMAGNVAEWVQDTYGDASYAQSPGADPQGPTEPAHADSASRVRRGGTWIQLPNALRCAARDRLWVKNRGTNTGCRLAVVLPPGAAPVAVRPQTLDLKPQNFSLSRLYPSALTLSFAPDFILAT